MNTKQNNKGFSLVELIVVIAIMGILAVTLAPRLTVYIEKSRVAKDREVITAMMTATSLGLTEEDIKADFESVAIEDATPATTYTLDLNATAFYTITNVKEWAPVVSTDPFMSNFHNIVGDFKFSSKDVTADAKITILYTVATDKIKITFDPDGDALTVAKTYELIK